MQPTLAGLGRLDSEMEAGIDSPVGRPRTYDAAIEAEPEPAAVAAAAAPAPPISFKIGFVIPCKAIAAQCLSHALVGSPC